MKSYRMTQDELTELKKAAATPGVFTGGILAGYDPAGEASKVVWKKLAAKYGFVWDTARKPVAGDARDFDAIPVPAPSATT